MTLREGQGPQEVKIRVVRRRLLIEFLGEQIAIQSARGFMALASPLGARVATASVAPPLPARSAPPRRAAG